MELNKYILLDENNVVVGIEEVYSVFELFDLGITFYSVEKVEGIIPEIGDKYFR
jgi:hypothetical protein